MKLTPEQIANPVVTQRLSEGVVKPKVLSEEAKKLFRLTPEKTVWGWDFGRPIIDRLPFWSQAYNKGYDQDQAYVYYDPAVQRSWLGPGTCEVRTDIRAKHLIIVEDGELTFKGGTLKVDRLVVNIAKLGQTQLNVQSGRFYVGYTLDIKYPEKVFSLVPGHSLLQVENYLLDQSALSFGASQEQPNFEAFNALTTGDLSGSWRPQKNGKVASYNSGPSFFLDFQAPVYTDRFRLVPDSQVKGTSRCSAYYSDDGITWTHVVDEDAKGGEWQIPIDRDLRHRYWQFLFWDGTVSVQEVYFTGEAYFMDKRVSAPVPIATPFLRGIYDDDNFAQADKTEVILATVEVKNSIVTKVIDNRKSSKTKYEPVAEWLTDFQDANLRCRFNDVINYASDFLSPQTGHYSYYRELEDSHCWGVGQLDLQGAPIELDLPEVVELYDTYFDRLPYPYLVDNTFYPENEWDLSNVDPDCTPYFCRVNNERYELQDEPDVTIDSEIYQPPLDFKDTPDGFFIVPGTQIRPKAIYNLKDGTSPGDVVNMKQVYDTFEKLAFLDNGNY